MLWETSTDLKPGPLFVLFYLSSTITLWSEYLLLSSPFYKWRNWGPERLNNLPKVTEPASRNLNPANVLVDRRPLNLWGF